MSTDNLVLANLSARCNLPCNAQTHNQFEFDFMYKLLNWVICSSGSKWVVISQPDAHAPIEPIQTDDMK